MTQIPGYYTRNGILYADSRTEPEQDGIRKATAYVCALIAKNEATERAARTWHEQNNPTFHPILCDTIAHPWFWVLALPRHSPGYRGYPRSGGCCSAPSGRDADGCAKVGLVVAIIALASLCIIATGFTIYQGVEAEKERRMLREIETCATNSSDTQIKAIFTSAASYQRELWMRQSRATFFSATVALGFGCLTVSAAFALYGVLSATPISTYTVPFAIAGGSATCLGLTGHLIHYLIVHQKRSQDIAFLKALYAQLASQAAPHPYQLLNRIRFEGNVALIINGQAFIREGLAYRRQADGSPPHYTLYTVENRD